MELLYGIIEVQVWEGGRRPKLVGTDVRVGIIKKDWLYFKGHITKNGLLPFSKYTSYTLSKYNLYANKAIWHKKYLTYAELIKNHPEHKGKVKYFNSIKKELSK